MKFSQGKIVSIVFLLAIMLIALMFSMYESEGFLEGARGRNKKRKQIKKKYNNTANAVNNSQDQRINTLETRVGTLETQGQAQQAAPYNNGPVEVPPMDDEIAQ
jgi:Tfp pilus assembly protein PilO